MAVHVHKKLAASTRPANTTATSAYSPGAGVEATIKQISICNTSGGNVTYRLFHDAATTYDETSAIAWDVALAADTTDILDVFIAINGTENLAVRTNTNNAITFSLWGAEIT